MFCSLNAIDCLKFRFVNNVIWRPDKRCFPHSALPHKNQPQLVITTWGRPIKELFLQWLTIGRIISRLFLHFSLYGMLFTWIHWYLVLFYHNSSLVPWFWTKLVKGPEVKWNDAKSLIIAVEGEAEIEHLCFSHPLIHGGAWRPEGQF